ncbi:unnamed protein product [Phytomonas sp. Hart1]|nr:unnamed protein product [Phytomonas sp. Hart1]|eukprot:CCW66768.1 unnamed protein product [Phytomonas sp. isolate Hart1]
MVTFQSHVYSSLVFENDLQLLKNLLQSTTHRYLAVCVFVAVTAPFVFSTVHFMARKRRDTLTKLASKFEYIQIDYLNANQYGSELNKDRGTDSTPLSTHNNDRDSTNTEIVDGKKNVEEKARGVILPPESTFNSAKRRFYSFHGIVGHQSDSCIDEHTILTKHSRKGKNNYDGSTMPHTKYTLQSTTMANANNGRRNYISSYWGSLSDDFFFKSAFASVSVSYSPTNLSIWSGSHLHSCDVQMKGTLSTGNYYPSRRKQLILRLCDDYSQLLTPLAQVILAKQRATDEDFAHSVASTACTFFVLKSVRSLCGMAAQDAIIHITVFCISRTLARFVCFYNTGSNRVYVPRGALGDLTFAVTVLHPFNILRIVRNLAVSLIRDPIFTGFSSFAYLKSPQNEDLNSSRALEIDSLLSLYVFVMSADSPTVRCCLPLWLVPMWRLLLFVKWVSRPAAALWLRSRIVFEKSSGAFFIYRIADEIWKRLTPKGYFVCMLLYSLPDIIMHSFLELDWRAFCERMYQLLCNNKIYKKVQVHIPRFRFGGAPFLSTQDKTLCQNNVTYMDLFTDPGRWRRKARSFYKFMCAASRKFPQRAWRTGKYLYSACPDLAGALVNAGFCFTILSILPNQTFKASTSPAWSHGPGLHFYVLGCLRGILIAVRWAWSAKVE